MIGETLGKYQIVEKIGRGGMAEVYKAYHPDLDRYVAIKIMHLFLVDEAGFADRFQREAQSVARLRHPNIVQVHDFNTEGDVSYMVMEFVAGPSLKSMLAELEAQGRWLSLEQALRIVRDVGEALDYAHQRGMVHRDVKPANIMLTFGGSAILTDFGIVKMLTAGGTTGLTASGALIGTPAYMAPEQCMGAVGDERTDVYSLGIVLYQLVTRRLPFDADTPMAIVFKHVNSPLPIPSALNPDLPQGIERVILKSLAKNPDDRYRSVREMLTHLDRAMRGEMIPAVDPSITMASQPGTQVPALAGGVPPARRRGRWIIGLVGLGLVAALVVGGFLALGGRTDATPTPEPTEVVMATFTLTHTPTSTPQPTQPPTPSATQTPSPTPEPSQTHTPAPSPTSTETPMPTLTSTARPSPTRTEIPRPTFGVGSPATALRNANVFPTTNSDTAPLTLVREGETVTVLGHYGDWLNVRAANGVTGWVYQPGWFEVPGDIDVLPTVVPPQLSTPVPTSPPCDTGPLTLVFYNDPGTDQCRPGGGWSVNVHFIVSGGNCVYTYYWEGVRIHGPTTQSEFIYTVNWGDAALTGTGRVESGAEAKHQSIFVSKPPQCP